MGRPKKQDKDKRNKAVSLFMTEKEKADLERAASVLNTSKTAVVVEGVRRVKHSLQNAGRWRSKWEEKGGEDGQ